VRSLRALVAVVALGASAGVACERHERAPVVDASAIAIGKLVTIRTDQVGPDPACQPRMVLQAGRQVPTVPIECVGKAPDPAKAATFVLVDVDNRDQQDAIVTLGGVLVDGDGQEVGRLAPAALRIPAGARRTFALIDSEKRARPTATDARLDVREVAHPAYPEPVRITDGEVSREGGQVVASGTVENLTDKPAQVIIIAGFQDAAGKPLTRPFALYQLGPRAKKPALFTGPPGTATGYIFVGQVEF
jgi:hypothetical protein